MLNKITVDLFSGVGGFSLGAELAGLNVKCAIEIDAIHADYHQLNFPRTEVINEDIKTVTGDRIKEVCESKEIFCVIGGSPCQGFSMEGKRDIDDPRNDLAFEFVRLVKELQPNYFVFENVKGLTQGKAKDFLNKIIEEFENSGYHIIKPWKVLNAKNFGVPQSRQRLILMGSRKDLPLLKYPRSQSHIVNCEEAIGDLINIKDEPGTNDYSLYVPPIETSDYIELMRSDRMSLYSRVRDNYTWGEYFITNCQLTKHTDVVRDRFAATLPGTKDTVSRFRRLSPDGVCNTLKAGTDAKKGSFTAARPIHYSLPRCITVREMARLHSFPDWFEFHPSVWHGARQIGNAIPPLFAKAILEMLTPF